jgi:methylated-DNA-[protein]-cysteine S-methyltransferase
MNTDNEREVCALPIATADGEFLARYSMKGLCGLEFPSGKKPSGGSGKAGKTPPEIRRWHQVLNEALGRALAGQAPGNLPPLDLSAGTAFQQRVWRTLQKIRCGRTWSYAQVAEAMGKPKAVRAVGGACGVNPIPVFVPCHRVVAAHGIGGFSGGLKWKRLLLEREGWLKSENRSLERQI